MMEPMNERDGKDFRLRGARGAILGLLRRGDRTVAELAPAVGLTRNGVRLHLGRMEAEGLVEPVGTQPGVSKSSRLYGLSAAGRLVYSRAYGAFLEGLIAELVEREAGRPGAPRTRELFAAVARRLGPPAGEPADREARLAGALAFLRGLGAEPVLEERGDGLELSMPHCPLSDVSARHAEVCEFGRALVAAWTGETVVTRCTRGERPHCRFALGSPAA